LPQNRRGPMAIMRHCHEEAQVVILDLAAAAQWLSAVQSMSTCVPSSDRTPNPTGLQMRRLPQRPSHRDGENSGALRSLGVLEARTHVRA
jgi:hypothetical protein